MKEGGKEPENAGGLLLSCGFEKGRWDPRMCQRTAIKSKEIVPGSGRPGETSKKMLHAILGVEAEGKAHSNRE